MIEGPGYYRHVRDCTTFCIHVLTIRHKSKKGYTKVKCDWYNRFSGMFLDPYFFGLKRNFKIDRPEDWIRFKPKWR